MWRWGNGTSVPAMRWHLWLSVEARGDARPVALERGKDVLSHAHAGEPRVLVGGVLMSGHAAAREKRVHLGPPNAKPRPDVMASSRGHAAEAREAASPQQVEDDTLDEALRRLSTITRAVTATAIAATVAEPGAFHGAPQAPADGLHRPVPVLDDVGVGALTRVLENQPELLADGDHLRGRCSVPTVLCRWTVMKRIGIDVLLPGECRRSRKTA